MINYSIIQKSQIETAHRIDAEYFQPIFLNIEKKVFSSKSYKLWGDIEGHFITGPFGSEFIVDDYTTDSHYRYIRGKDVKEFFLHDEDNVYIPESDFVRLKKYSLKEGDILVSVVGTLGNVSIVDNSMLPAIFSCKSTAFRTQSINAYYLLAYLNSKYGHSLLEQNMRGAVQTGLNIEDLRSLPIFIPKKEQQDAISSIIINAKKIFNESKVLYTQAEELLLNELGLKDFKIEDDLAYTVNLSNIKSAHRADAEYFKPKYEKLEKLFHKFQLKKLEDLSSLISYGTVPTSPYVEKNGLPYVKGENLQNCFIDYSKLVYLEEESTKDLPQKFYLKEDDIIISQMGTVGHAAIVTKQEEGWVFASFTIRVRLKEEIKRNLDPLLIALFIQNVSRPYYLLRKISQASVRQNTDLPTIKNLQIPILPRSTQQKIADLVRQSHEARKKVKELLEKAKKEVEKLIGKAE
jgi:restriction endonuclease S subunit